MCPRCNPELCVQAAAHPRQPTVSGDLNCDGSDAAIKLLTTGAVEADDPDWLHGGAPQPPTLSLPLP
jgi:hypothetical protein